MSFETWTAFALAATAMLAVPEPTIPPVVGQSPAAGRRRALLAGRVSRSVGRPEVRRGFNKAGGSVLVGAGLATAAMRRA